MKRTNRHSSTASTASTEKENTMKRTNRHSSTASTASTEKENTMKRTNRHSSTASTASKDDPKKAALAALAALGIDVNALFNTVSEDKPKSQKADRLYEMPALGADFTKSGIYAAPKSDEAGRYMDKTKALCSDTLENLSAPITGEVKAIAEKAEKNGGISLKDDLLTLADTWKIPPQSMRVIMQLCAPVVCACNSETDDIARCVYGMARANALMGSACNTLMYNKVVDKGAAIPFKRVAHNLTALGLDFDECAFVGQCDFCDKDAAFDELVRLCDMWLKKCERIAPQKSEDKHKQKQTQIKTNTNTSASKDNSQIIALLQSLLNK